MERTRNTWLIFLFMIYGISANAQIEKVIEELVYTKGKSSVSKSKDILDTTVFIELDSLISLLKFNQKFAKEHEAVSVKTSFGLLGNESSLNDLFRINSGVQISKGVFPFEFDLNAKIQATFDNGKVAENISDVFMSLDYHPLKEQLWLENFVFLSRFNNTFLGIDQRYETGVGIIFNNYSKNNLNSKGIENKKKIDRYPTYELTNGKLTKCYEDVCKILSSEIKISEEDIANIKSQHSDFNNINFKNNAIWRFALLLGMFYENEKARLENPLISKTLY